MLIFTPKYFFHTSGSETGVKSPTMSYIKVIQNKHQVLENQSYDTQSWLNSTVKCSMNLVLLSYNIWQNYQWH